MQATDLGAVHRIWARDKDPDGFFHLFFFSFFFFFFFFFSFFFSLSLPLLHSHRPLPDMAATTQESAVGYACLILQDQKLEVTADKIIAIAKVAAAPIVVCCARCLIAALSPQGCRSHGAAHLGPDL